MAAETFVTALLLITAVISAGILINAVYPVVWNMAGTFSSASHETDTRMRTDFKVIVTYARADTDTGDIYLKNIGSNPISASEIEKGDVVFGKTGQFTRLAFNPGSIGAGEWTYEGYSGIEYSYDLNKNRIWDTGETLHIIAHPNGILITGDPVYFEFVTPNGVARTAEFTVS
jgi:flagellar protein FlaG